MAALEILYYDPLSVKFVLQKRSLYMESSAALSKKDEKFREFSRSEERRVGKECRL